MSFTTTAWVDAKPDTNGAGSSESAIVSAACAGGTATGRRTADETVEGRVNDRQDHEDHSEKLDRELIELLNELRVMLPGVQALFAFLLIVPFSERFDTTTTNERVAYYIALAAAALSSICFITPSVYHRVQFRQHDKERLLRLGNVVVVAGTVVLGLGIASAVYFVTGFLVDDTVGLVAGSTTFVIVTIMWWGLPLAARRPGGRAHR